MTACSFHAAVPEPASRKTDFLVGVNADILILQEVGLNARRWFLPNIEPFQERLGGRIALVAQINVAGSKFVTYNLHLESRGSNTLRISQLREVLSDATCYDAECPGIVAGDLNLDASREVVAFAVAKAGFQDAVRTPHTPTTPARGLFEGGRQIDWAFVRGPVRACPGHVHSRVKASDHYPISFMLTG